MFLTRNTQFHNKDTAPTDTAMAFVKTWPPNQARERSQVYWVENHGSLVQEVGLPAVITSYTQLHFDSVEGDYQGLSFETITSQRDMVQTLVRDPAARRLNRILLSDEEQFTGPPLFLAFREVSA